MRINRNTILNYINNPQLFEDKEKEEIRNELARQGIQQEREKQYYIKEIERLNNIINEFDSWLKEKKEQMEEFELYKRKETGAFWYSTMGNIDTFIEKIKELKGDSSNE